MNGRRDNGSHGKGRTTMATALNVLIVEDSVDDAELLVRELRRGGYEPSHKRIASQDDVIEALDAQQWDIILCDYTMLGFSGTHALSLVRGRDLDTPFIFVSGTIDEETAVSAMRAGANDYVLKGNLKRLVPAIERELREARSRREKLRAEEQRRATEKRFREVLAMAPDAIVAVDGAQRITIFNRAAEALFGYTAEEAAGQPLDLLLPPSFLADFPEAPAASGRMNEVKEVFGRRKNGEEFPAEASVSKVVENGMPTFMAVIRDVTQRRLLEEQLRQAQKMEAVGQLTGGLAHDFNNLLTVIIGNLDLLQEQLDAGTEPYELTAQAFEASLRGAQLTHKLLAFSRRQSLETKVFDLNHLVADTADLLRRTLGEQIEIEMRLARDLAPGFADPTQVEAALVNVAINARDAMPSGGILVIETSNARFRRHRAVDDAAPASSRYVALSVSDTGTGIPKEVLGKVFEPFFTTKEKGKGTGLGLSMIYGFAKQSGGHVEISSEVGRGTTIRLYLPQADAAVGESRGAVPAEPGAERRSATVLVVEDDADVRRITVNQLKSLGYQVVEAEHGTAAMAVLAGDQAVDLLLSDVVMPGGMSGHDVAREALALRADLKVLLISGYTDARSNGGPAGSPALLRKPYRKAELDRRIRETLSR
jgi:PAS domain S-box-containing protein